MNPFHGTGQGQQAHFASENNGRPDMLAQIAAKVLRTREARQLTGSVAFELARIWAGDSRLRQAAAGRLGRVVENGMKRHSDSSKNFSALFDDPEFMEQAAGLLPVLFNLFGEAALKFVNHLEKLPPQQRKQHIEQILSGADPAQAGQVLTALSRLANSMYKDNPYLLADALAPALGKWVEETDFGELRDTLEHATGDLMVLTDRFWAIMRRYPAKVVTILSALPNVANIMLYAAKETAGQISGLFGSPDMIADFMLSVLRRLDAAAAADLVNQLCELSRKLHTGSGLLGEPGAPAFAGEISAFVDQVIDNIDMAVLNKARSNLADGRETFHRAFLEKIRNEPERYAGFLETSTRIRNLCIKMMREKISLLEEINEHRHPGNARDGGAEGLNTHDLAEIVNTVSRRVNRIRDEDENPDPAGMAEFAEALDTDAFREAAEWIAEKAEEALRPAGRILAPHLIRILCRWSLPEEEPGGRRDPQIRDAAEAVKNLAEAGG